VVIHRCVLLRMSANVLGQKSGHMLLPCAEANRALASVKAL
jgi:hypothetical protein